MTSLCRKKLNEVALPFDAAALEVARSFAHDRIAADVRDDGDATGLRDGVDTAALLALFDADSEDITYRVRDLAYGCHSGCEHTGWSENTGPPTDRSCSSPGWRISRATQK